MCVTAVEDIEKAMEIARKENVIFTTFGDMMRVPGIKKNLAEAKAEGADIRVLYSPIDALKIASENKRQTDCIFCNRF